MPEPTIQAHQLTRVDGVRSAMSLTGGGQEQHGVDDELWRRTFTLVLDGFRSDQDSPLPGTHHPAQYSTPS